MASRPRTRLARPRPAPYLRLEDYRPVCHRTRTRRPVRTRPARRGRPGDDHAAGVGLLRAQSNVDNRLIHWQSNFMIVKPVVAGTEFTLELILEKLAAGETVVQLLEAYPRDTRSGVSAALEFTARALSEG